MTDKQLKRYIVALASAMTLGAGTSLAQQAPAAKSVTTESADEETIVLSPFEVSAEQTNGYAAATTLAGSRLSTELKDVGSAISVVTEQFMKDVGAVNNETLLQYTTATEVGNVQGNFTGVGNGATMDESGKFTNPNTNTRVRGLAAADNTRDFFISDIPWDGYNIDRVDMQRGPNAILFGLGSPAGIINNSTKGASFKTGGNLEFRFDRWGSTRTSLNANQVVLKGELAFRVAGLYNNEKFQQKPAFQRDKRYYLATRYEPKFLRKNGAHTTFKLNFEQGDVASNRPRSLPPIDYITDWFKTGTYTGYDSKGNAITYQNLNRQTFDPFIVQDDVTQLANHGQNRPTYNVGGGRNPYFQPLLGNFAQQYGGPLAYFNGNSSNQSSYFVSELRTINGIGTNGKVDGNIGGIPYHRMVGLNQYYLYAKAANLPWSQFGLYKNRSLTDSTVFDFYNNLIDGPNKHEWSKFQAYNGSINQTFLDNTLGFEFVYDKQVYKNGQTSLMSDQRQAIYVDMMATLSDGTANPNVGRPFISDSTQYGNNSYRSDRDSVRATGYYTLDFQKYSRSWVTRALGKHTFTGMVSRDNQSTDRRSFMRYGTDEAFKQAMNGATTTLFTDNMLQINPVIYLGDSLLNKSTASGAYIPAPTAIQTPTSGTVKMFDSTWTATGVDPAAAWTNTWYPEGSGQRTSTQSENPANYAGWKQIPFNVYDSSKGYQDYLTYQAALNRSMVTSKAIVWQGSFWDKLVVPMFGYRKDRAKSWAYQPSTSNGGIDSLGHVALGSTYKLPSEPNSIVADDSRSWSVVSHLNTLLPKNFPIDISLFYNTSENFQPAAGRVDVYGSPLGAPKGKTTEKGIRLATKDDRYSIKINKYETTVKDATSSSIANSWFLGALEGWGGTWANIFQYDLGGTTMDTAGQGNSGRYNYGPATGETDAQAAAREQAAIAAWRTHQSHVPAAFYKAWGIEIDKVKNLSSASPSGLALTEDATSTGYEIELNAQPTSAWRISLNAAKTKAIRENIGGAAFINFVNIVETDLKTTPAGDLRIWWGGAGNTNTLLEWNNNVGSDWAMKKLQNGTAAPELREWRVNLITNYDFKHGFAKGFSVGGGWRWQDDVTIGYKPVAGKTAQDVSFDLANPYKGPSESNFDAWIGYSHKLTKAIDYRIQLNVRNLFEKNRLIPISTQPDGSIAGYRIAPPMSWYVTNTFSF